MRLTRPLFARFAALAALSLAPIVCAQEILPHEVARRTQVLGLDSGPVAFEGGRETTVHQTLVRVDDAPWLRLYFSNATLAPGAFVRVTSAKDGYSQTLDAAALQVWGNSTAYFNGDTLLVEIVARRAGVNHLVISEAEVGMEPDRTDTICGTVDDRTQSNDPRQGRGMPIGCTAWLISDCARCFLTAGHCSTSSLQVIQFNVPNSLANGAVQNPPPSDQYSVDVSSKQFVNGGIGNDWGYFGVFRNTTTGLTPYEAMGHVAYSIAAAAPPATGQTFRITGYGTTSPANFLNQVQKTHTGAYVSVVGNTLRYSVDTTGGNSGSPVEDLTTGLAVGIHTHAGCTSTGGANQGTNIGIAALRTALLNPRGVCLLSLVGDTNGDRRVDFADLNRVLSEFGLTGAPGQFTGDLNRDGVVNFTDVNLCLAYWGEIC